jgi:nucleotide-binding universal stress UspA family protein
MRVLIAYDGSVYAMAAIDDLRHAGLPPHTEAIVVSVAHHGWPKEQAAGEKGEFDNPWKAAMKEIESVAEEGKNCVQGLFPSWSVSCEGLWGDPARTLLKTIDVWKPDLVVMGSHGRSTPARLFLGSVSTELIHKAPCSVRIVRHPTRDRTPIRVLVATDGSDQGQACIDAVARRSWPEGTRARVLGVVQSLVPIMTSTVPAIEAQTLVTEPAAQIIEEADARERVKLRWTVDNAVDRLQQAGLVADALVLDGDPRHEINAEAERWLANCVFVGARGLGALDRLVLGSVSTALVHQALCAVEVVRHR